MKKDPELGQLLHAWQAGPPEDAHFRQGVWNHIDAQEGGRVRQFLRVCKDWCIVSLPKPAYAAALILVFVVSGAAFAETIVEKIRLEKQAEMERGYVASIDPVAMVSGVAHSQP